MRLQRSKRTGARHAHAGGSRYAHRTVTQGTALAAAGGKTGIIEASHVETGDAGRADAAVLDRGVGDAANATRHRRRDGEPAAGLFPPAQ